MSHANDNRTKITTVLSYSPQVAALNTLISGSAFEGACKRNLAHQALPLAVHDCKCPPGGDCRFGTHASLSASWAKKLRKALPHWHRKEHSLQEEGDDASVEEPAEQQPTKKRKRSSKAESGAAEQDGDDTPAEVTVSRKSSLRNRPKKGTPKKGAGVS